MKQIPFPTKNALKNITGIMLAMLLALAGLLPSGCKSTGQASKSQAQVNDGYSGPATSISQPSTEAGYCAQDDEDVKNVGFRFSVYGARRTPNTKEYWYNSAEKFNSYFTNTRPEFIWIVGNLRNKGCNLGFPAETDHPMIHSSETDLYDETFRLFSKMGVKVWLSFEPGHAPVDELLHLILKQYSHHSCIVGIGIDVEWNDCAEGSKGTPVSDEDALRWIAIAKQYNADYQFMFRHWLPSVMPPTVRENVKFVSNSQMFPSLTRLVREFQRWGEAFYPAPIGFQIGYPRDQEWWGEFDNPPKTIADSLFAAIPNLNSLYWVDFSTQSVFPPLDPEDHTGNLLAMARGWSASTDRFGSSYTTGESLIENGIASATFNQTSISDRGTPWVEMICRLNGNIGNYSRGSITYKCGTDLLIKLSQSDFGPDGNKTYSHYQLRVPASSDWTTIDFDLNDFAQPEWAPEISRTIPLKKENIDAIYLVPDLDYQKEESTTLQVRDMRLSAGQN
jgi:hypothetical protein